MNSLDDIILLAGSPIDQLKSKPFIPYSENALAFLANLSKQLLKLPEIRQYPDIATFAFWCRNANLSKLIKEQDQRFNRVGRGLAFHITPANVPVNFAYSFAFGLLAGNANIVRLSEREFPQAQIIYEQIAGLLQKPEFAPLKASNSFVRYPRASQATAIFSMQASTRVIWGGDETINHISSLPTQPRCADIVFADRFSVCVLSAQSVLESDNEQIKGLVQNFYNDVFVLDQNACSSPHLIYWLGDENDVKNAQSRFWQIMEQHVKTHYQPEPFQMVDRFVKLCETAIDLNDNVAIDEMSSNVQRVMLESLPANLDHHRGHSGFVYEYSNVSLEPLSAIIDQKYQTLTYFGLEKSQLLTFVIENGLLGIDRIVPVGRALDMNVIWDGYDLINQMSRIVHTA